MPNRFCDRHFRPFPFLGRGGGAELQSQTWMVFIKPQISLQGNAPPPPPQRIQSGISDLGRKSFNGSITSWYLFVCCSSDVVWLTPCVCVCVDRDMCLLKSPSRPSGSESNYTHTHTYTADARGGRRLLIRLQREAGPSGSGLIFFKLLTHSKIIVL